MKPIWAEPVWLAEGRVGDVAPGPTTWTHAVRVGPCGPSVPRTPGSSAATAAIRLRPLQLLLQLSCSLHARLPICRCCTAICLMKPSLSATVPLSEPAGKRAQLVLVVRTHNLIFQWRVMTGRHGLCVSWGVRARRTQLLAVRKATFRASVEAVSQLNAEVQERRERRSRL